MNKLLLAAIIILCPFLCLAECQLHITSPIIDYGNISHDEFSSSHKKWITLNEREVNIYTFCSEPQKIAFFVTGEQGVKGFRMGGDGEVLISAGQAILDGKSVTIGETVSHSPFVLKSHSGRGPHVLLNNHGLIPIKNESILSGQQFSVTLRIKPILYDNTRRRTENIELTSMIHISVEGEE